jgi:hypothetical protein
VQKTAQNRTRKSNPTCRRFAGQHASTSRTICSVSLAKPKEIWGHLHPGQRSEFGRSFVGASPEFIKIANYHFLKPKLCSLFNDDACSGQIETEFGTNQD